MSSVPPPKPDVPTPEQAAATGTVATRIAVRQRAGGIVVPVITALIAFLIGGVVVLATGHNPGKWEEAPKANCDGAVPLARDAKGLAHHDRNPRRSGLE